MNEQPADPDPASALAEALHALFGKLKRRLRGQAIPGDLTWAQISVLRRLDRDGPATVTTLARAEGVRPQSMGATIAALQAAEMVTGAPDPDDGRQTILSLSAACKDWIEAGRAARQDWLLQAIRTKFSPAEQEELVRAVALLERLADP
ncbi:MAG: MarR family transcriptional regulator [Acetobacteraceae bacterium]|nr:MarR family transcriptional regulator [Acetobacteraceae bacterium]